ncbi:MAG: vitamin K epoxide reductase family protein [Planctomycetota bacterium]|jgi:uncharacterized membrane protein
MSRTRSHLAVGLALLTAVLALVLRFETARHEATGRASSCRWSERVDCDLVQASAYAKVFGVSLSTWGAAGSLVLVAWLIGARRLGPTLLVGAGALAAFNFLVALLTAYLSWFELGAVCLYCSAMQLSIVAVAVVVVPAALRARSAGLRREPALLGGLIGALILGLAVAGDSYASRRAELLQLYTRPQGNALRSDLSDVAQLGNPTADISVVIFFDFGCPRCDECYRKARYLLRKHPDQLHFVFKNWPLDRACNPTLSSTQHPASCRAALAGLAAQRLGHGAGALAYLFDKRTEGFSWPVIEGLARSLDVPWQEFETVFQSPEMRYLLARDVVEGNALRLDGVPTAWINGRLIDASRLVERVERLLGR